MMQYVKCWAVWTNRWPLARMRLYTCIRTVWHGMMNTYSSKSHWHVAMEVVCIECENDTICVSLCECIRVAISTPGRCVVWMWMCIALSFHCLEIFQIWWQWHLVYCSFHFFKFAFSFCATNANRLLFFSLCFFSICTWVPRGYHSPFFWCV